LGFLNAVERGAEKVQLNTALQRSLMEHALLRGSVGLLRVMQFYSQWREDRMIAPFLGRRGWVVDVGANDGLHGSNSRHFILKGFSAVCIDPDPRAFAALETLYRGVEGVSLFNCGCGVREGSSFLRAAPDSQLSRVVAGHPPDDDPGGHHPGVLPVAIRPLDAILEEAGVDSIDLVSIDVEGGEWDVLQGFDIGRWRPRIAVIETHNDSSIYADAGLVFDYMKRSGYRRCGTTRSNCLWAAAELDVPWLTQYKYPTSGMRLVDELAHHASCEAEAARRDLP
jgi:FkbM family methyltransferase